MLQFPGLVSSRARGASAALFELDALLTGKSYCKNMVGVFAGGMLFLFSQLGYLNWFHVHCSLKV